MAKEAFLQRTFDRIRRFPNRLESITQKGSVCLILIVLMVLASVFKTELVFMELTIKLPLLLMVALLFGGENYYIRVANRLQRKKMQSEESRVKIVILVLSLTSVSAHVIVKYTGLPVDIVQWWVGVWIVIGAEALVEMLNGLNDDKDSGSSQKKGKNGGDGGEPITITGPKEQQGPSGERGPASRPKNDSVRPGGKKVK